MTLRRLIFVALLCASCAMAQYVPPGGGGSGSTGPTGSEGPTGPAGAPNFTTSLTFTGTQTKAVTHNLNTTEAICSALDATTGANVTAAVFTGTTAPTSNAQYATATNETINFTCNASGVTGATGPSGANGPTGATGPSGGAQGPTGPTGPTGAAGGATVLSQNLGTNNTTGMVGNSTRAFSTGSNNVYQNTFSTNLFVSVSCSSATTNSQVQMVAFTDANATPVQTFAINYNPVALSGIQEWIQVFMIVLPGNYYKITDFNCDTNTDANGTLWIETH